MPKARATTIVELAVVVYSGRQLDQAGGGETAFACAFAPGSNVVTLKWNPTVQDTPDVTLGGWIFDATMQPDPHRYFYRVVGTGQPGPSADPTDPPGTMAMDVEVQSKLRGFGTGNKGVVVIMDNVVEVFERGTF